MTIGSRVTILGECARVLNRGTVVAQTQRSWIVRLDGLGRIRFGKRTLAIVVKGRRVRPIWPRIAP